MPVEVRLFAMFRENRFKKREMEFPEATSLANLLERLRIPENGAAILLVNGRNVSVEYKLAPHDVVSIFSAVGGG